MIWFKILSSSIGNKFVMSLMGFLLMIFLTTHLCINLLLVLSSSTDMFNRTAHFLGTNMITRMIEVIIFLIFFIHIGMGILVQIQNWRARPLKYKVNNYSSQQSFFSRWMFHTALVMLTFLAIHLTNFFYKIKFSHETGLAEINGKEYYDAAALVMRRFQSTGFVIFYLFAFIALAFHLNHGFQSAFQTLGVNQKKYTPFIKLAGKAYSIVIPGGFAFIVLYFYFQ